MLSVWIAGPSANAADKSDRVSHLHTDHDDERGPGGELWNSRFHHSFYVVFQRTRKAAGTGAPSLPEGVSVQFRAEPDAIKPGGSVTLRCGSLRIIQITCTERKRLLCSRVYFTVAGRTI